MSEEERNCDGPLLGPFIDLDSRKVPFQDDNLRGLILTVYLIFLMIVIPIWWYFTNVPAYKNPLAVYAPKNLSEFSVNVHFEDESIVPNWKEYSMAIGNYYFNFKNRIRETSSLNFPNHYEIRNLNIILSSVEVEMIKIDKRTLKVPSSIDLKAFLTDIVDSFKVPNLQKSEIKLKFTFLTNSNFKTENNFKTRNLNNFISHLIPVLSFKSSFQTKFFDGKISELTAEMFIGSNPIVKIDSRDERGREDIFNLVFLLTDTANTINDTANTINDTANTINDTANTINVTANTINVTDSGLDNYKTLYIPNWGIIVTGSKYIEEHIENVFISGLKRFLGFPKNKNLPEMFEIEFWNEKLKEFYFEKSSEMSKSLTGSKSIEANGAKEAFDIIEQVYNDPKLLAAAYFPDDHKFAVYLPVYLPLILPILVGLISFIKKKKKKEKESEVEEIGELGNGELKVKKE